MLSSTLLNAKLFLHLTQKLPLLFRIVLFEPFDAEIFRILKQCLQHAVKGMFMVGVFSAYSLLVIEGKIQTGSGKIAANIQQIPFFCSKAGKIQFPMP